MDLGLDQLQGQLEKLQKLPKPYRMALIPTVVVVVAAVYVYLMYMPAKAQLDGIREQELQLQRKLAEVRSVASNEERVKQEIEELERKLAVALRQLPDDKELPVLLTDVTSLGKNAGLDFKAFRPQPEFKREFYAEVPIELEFTGNFHDIASFFDEVSRLPRIVNIGELDITIEREGSEQTMLKVKGNATTFRFIENDPATESEPAPKGRAGRKAARKATAGRGGQ
jgi:type IV pilus assembly protein PilO